jgi:Glycosyl hydrolase family 57
MSAPARQQESPTPAAETAILSLFAMFHLNLAFSSIEEKDRSAVIQRCYWPLLAIATSFGPIGIEATGYTLEEIEARDPKWIARLRDLIAAGKVEFIGSGYAQLIGPLVPAKVVAANLRIGNEIYQRALKVRPRIALVNEQAYSAGIVGHYLDAGYRALLMDWDNPSAHHPEWPAEARYQAQEALGADGRAIDLLWTNTVAFQKLQRFAHGDIEIDDYLEFIATHRSEEARALCIYASDAEIFDFRPGRYKTEEAMSGESEWQRLAGAFSQLHGTPGMRLTTPSAALEHTKSPSAKPVSLETAACPVPVKKQRKYNLTRWAVTGRDDIAINAACQRIYAALSKKDAGDGEWKTLCRLWASDFRTHITDARWKAYCAELTAMETRVGCKPSATPNVVCGKKVQDRFLEVATNALSARLDRRRGLALKWLAFGDDPPSIGGLPHGYFDDIALQADWYTGDCVLEQPGEPKVTDLEWADTEIDQDALGNTVVAGRISTPLGPIEKVLRFHADAPRLDFDLTFHWKYWPKGSLRLGHVTLLPDVFDKSRLTLTTHNGGLVPESFALHGQTVEHGAPVSFLVSASGGLGMTEGWAELSDGTRGVRVEVDREAAPLLGLLTHREVKGRLFCQLMLSMLELDDTSRATPYLVGPRRVRFSLIKC